MTIRVSHQFEDGITWYAENGSMGEPNALVLIPINTIDRMSDAEIGRRVREMLTVAHFADACNAASYVTYNLDRKPQTWMSEEALKYKDALLPFAQSGDAQIMKALRIIATHEEYLIHKAASPAKRREMNANYKSVMLALIQRDGAACAHCKTTTNLVIDHITPVIRGGSNDFSNLQLLCQSCNSIKGDR